LPGRAAQGVDTAPANHFRVRKRVGNSFDQLADVADISRDSVATLVWAELELIDGKRWIFAGLPVNVRTSA
jgi:hypothetical protein